MKFPHKYFDYILWEKSYFKSVMAAIAPLLFLFIIYLVFIIICLKSIQ